MVGLGEVPKLWKFVLGRDNKVWGTDGGRWWHGLREWLGVLDRSLFCLKESKLKVLPVVAELKLNSIEECSFIASPPEIKLW